MNFYTVNGSPNCRKVHAVINYLDLDVDICELDVFSGILASPEFLDLNPNGMVPLLEDGSYRLWESNAIMQYLASLTPASDFYPEALRSRADIHRWQSWEQAHLNRAIGTFVYENILKDLFNLGQPDEARLQDAARDVERFASILDDHLAGKRYLLGDNVTLADFSVAAMTDLLDAAQVPYHHHDNVCAWLDRLNTIPAWANTPKLAA